MSLQSLTSSLTFTPTLTSILVESSVKYNSSLPRHHSRCSTFITKWDVLGLHSPQAWLVAVVVKCLLSPSCGHGNCKPSLLWQTPFLSSTTVASTRDGCVHSAGITLQSLSPGVSSGSIPPSASLASLLVHSPYTLLESKNCLLLTHLNYLHPCVSWLPRNSLLNKSQFNRLLK